MKKGYLVTCVAAGLLAVGLAFGPAQASASCTPIPEASFTIDTIGNLNAAVVNPSSTVTGVVDATGCDIGVYFSPGTTGAVRNATVFGAQKAGIVNNGAKVTIDSNAIYQIGDNPLDGVQYGLAIYVYGLGSSPASGDVTHNTIWRFQKNGITIKGANSDVVGNTVIGEGPVDYIAQNGIEVAYGSTSDVEDNTVFGMSYTGAGEASSAGVLLIGGDCFGLPVQANTTVKDNNLSGNDVGVWLANIAADCASSQSTPTRNMVLSNMISDNGVFNATGGVTGAYQAGVAVLGDKDKVVGNSICGVGYTPQTSTPPYLFTVDSSLAISPVVANNGCAGFGGNGGNGGHGKGGWPRPSHD